MPKWEKTLEVKDLWEKYENDEINIEDLSKQVAKRLETLYPGDDRWMDIQDFIDRFECVEDVEEFDDILDELYDWGDNGHRLWIKTAF
jgi:FMN phosphatase YigB (HAD superfamily)